jgi:hypothetical protein
MTFGTSTVFAAILRSFSIGSASFAYQRMFTVGDVRTEMYQAKKSHLDEQADTMQLASEQK